MESTRLNLPGDERFLFEMHEIIEEYSANDSCAIDAGPVAAASAGDGCSFICSDKASTVSMGLDDTLADECRWHWAQVGQNDQEPIPGNSNFDAFVQSVENRCARIPWSGDFSSTSVWDLHLSVRQIHMSKPLRILKLSVHLAERMVMDKSQKLDNKCHFYNQYLSQLERCLDWARELQGKPPIHSCTSGTSCNNPSTFSDSRSLAAEYLRAYRTRVEQKLNNTDCVDYINKYLLYTEQCLAIALKQWTGDTSHEFPAHVLGIEDDHLLNPDVKPQCLLEQFVAEGHREIMALEREQRELAMPAYSDRLDAVLEGVEAVRKNLKSRAEMKPSGFCSATITASAELSCLFLRDFIIQLQNELSKAKDRRKRLKLTENAIKHLRRCKNSWTNECSIISGRTVLEEPVIFGKVERLREEVANLSKKDILTRIVQEGKRAWKSDCVVAHQAHINVRDHLSALMYRLRDLKNKVMLGKKITVADKVLLSSRLVNSKKRLPHAVEIFTEMYTNSLQEKLWSITNRSKLEQICRTYEWKVLVGLRKMQKQSKPKISYGTFHDLMSCI